jgi:WD40 repeat protein
MTATHCCCHRFDRCICVFDIDKLDKPKEAFKRVKDCGKAGLVSLAFDPHNNVLLAGSLDGMLRVWSVEGRWGQHAVCSVLEKLHTLVYVASDALASLAFHCNSLNWLTPGCLHSMHVCSPLHTSSCCHTVLCCLGLCMYKAKAA